MSMSEEDEDVPEVKAFNASMKHLKGAILESVGTELSKHGFSLKASNGRFVRWHGTEKCDRFQLVFKDAEYGKAIQPHVGVRFERVEEIFHWTSGFELKYQKDTGSIGTSIGLMIAGDTRAHQSIIESAADIPRVAAEIVGMFHNYALPYFDKFGSLQAIDSELNDKPTRDTPHRIAPWLRCSTGAIVAKLVGRPDYPRLLKIYTDVMRKSDKGFYLPYFLALVKSLETVSELPPVSRTRG